MLRSLPLPNWVKECSEVNNGKGQRPKERDKVAWDTPQGQTSGKILRRLTSEIHIKGHRVAASKDNPEYLVESKKSGWQAAHKPSELRKK